MAFESLSERLQQTLKKIKGESRLTEQNMDEALRDIRLALLEADVNFKVVKNFVQAVKDQAIGQDVLSQLSPGQMVVKIVHDELIKTLGGEVSELNLAKKPTIIMMVGLQGTGKTTHVGKIARYVKEKQAKNPLLVACDIYRPAAIEQLQTIGQQLNIPVYSEGQINPVLIAEHAIQYAKEHNHDVIFIDTAGRLHIDDALMDELEAIQSTIQPQEILLVVDAMTGQDIVNVAEAFNQRLRLTGAVLTKLDGDARGGGALSIASITGVPIKFVGTGEKMENLDIFYPDRMADRILGMGDVLSLIEKASDVIDEKQAQKLADRMMNGQFDFNDMLEQMRQVKKLGSFSGILKMLPGMGDLTKQLNQIKDEDATEKLKVTESIILSMTKAERKNPQLLKAGRKQRIAKGSGRSIQEVNTVLKQYEQNKMMMSMMANGQMPGMPGGGYSRPQPVNTPPKHNKKKKKKR